MQMSLADSVHTYLIPCLSDLLTGFGLGALLEFSRTSPDMQYFLAICLGVAVAAGVLEYLFPSRNVPPWLSLCNATFSLVVTLSLTLNLLSQLCPPSGKELCLIPAYVMLCVPRMPPSTRALALQAGFALFLLLVFMALPTSRSVRPDGEMGSGWMLALSVLAGASLQTRGFHSEAIDLYLVQPGRLWPAGSVFCKGLLLAVIGMVSNTSLYHFMFERPNTVPIELFIGYGVLLLFACMQAASVWFSVLKEVLGRQAKWRLVVRIQHIIHALIVAAAWVFPLQLHSLRVLVMGVLFWVNLFRRLYSR